MATSGTVGQTTIDVTSVVEHAARRAGVLASSLTSEQITAARENLFLILSDLANRGISLFTISKQLLALTPGVATYPLSVGTVDVLKLLYRTSTPIPGTALSGTLYNGIDAGAGNTYSPCMVQLILTAGTNNLVVQSSPDGATWTTIQTIPAFTSTAGEVLWVDLTNFTANRAFRVLETVATATYVTGTTWNYGPEDILAAKLNRDQYYLLPNKTFAGRALQYWYDKQQTPQVWFWPVPNDSTAVAVVWCTLHIQDPGAYTNTLQIPQRWINGVIWLLSSYMVNELPNIDPAKLQFCMAMADKALDAAEGGESDGAPIQMDPGIAPYTI